MPSAVAFTSDFASGVKPFSVPTKSAPLTWSCRIKTRCPPESRAGAIVYCFAFGGGCSDVSWIWWIAEAFDVMWPVE